MKNLADSIENFILAELLKEQEPSVMVQRNELAEKLECAPSQISYVLSTRFTPKRGFVVESRRGSGGFVRIIRVTNEATKETTAKDLVEQLAVNGIVTNREQTLLKYMLSIIDTDESKKKAILQQAVALLNNTGRR